MIIYGMEILQLEAKVKLMQLLLIIKDWGTEIYLMPIIGQLMGKDMMKLK